MRKAARPESRPIGFGALAAKPNPTMILIAQAASAAEARKAADQGADGIITHAADGPGESVNAFWGTQAVLKDREAARTLVKRGGDFLVFDENTDAAVLLEEDLGYVMRIALDAPDTFLRSIESFQQIDALLVPPLEDALTVRRALELRRIAISTRKALLLPVRNDIEPSALEALRDCGVIGVVATGAAGAAALRPKIDGLGPRRRAKDTRAVRLAPIGAGVSVRVDEDEED
jgi:hypothetical protein